MKSKEEIDALVEERVRENLTPVDIEKMYDQMLDEVYPPFMDMYDASRVLKEVDPIAYRCGMNDWLDGEEYFELDGEYYRQDQVDKIREEIEDENAEE